MEICYNNLWKLLIDKRMKKTDLLKVANISTSTLAKLSKDKNVSVDVLGRICVALSCDIGDIMQIIPPAENEIDHSTDD